jgi:hypothetical protein
MFERVLERNQAHEAEAEQRLTTRLFHHWHKASLLLRMEILQMRGAEQLAIAQQELELSTQTRGLQVLVQCINQRLHMTLLASWQVWLGHDHDSLQQQRSQLRMLQVMLNHYYRATVRSAFHSWCALIEQRYVLERVMERHSFWSLSRWLHRWLLASVRLAAELSSKQLLSVQRDLVQSQQRSGARIMHTVLRQLQLRQVLGAFDHWCCKVNRTKIFSTLAPFMRTRLFKRIAASWRRWMLFVWQNLEEELHHVRKQQQLRGIALMWSKSCVIKAWQNWRKLLHESLLKRRQLRSVAMFWSKSVVTQALQLWKEFLAEKESNEQWLEEGLARLCTTMARAHARSVQRALYRWRMFSQNVQQRRNVCHSLRHEGLQFILHTCRYIHASRLATAWGYWVKSTCRLQYLELEGGFCTTVFRRLRHSILMRILNQAFQHLRTAARSHALDRSRLARIRLLVSQDRKQRLVRAWDFWRWFMSSLATQLEQQSRLEQQQAKQARVKHGHMVLAMRIHRLYLKYLAHVLSQWRLVCVCADAELDCMELERELSSAKQRHGLMIVKTNFSRISRDVQGVYLRQWCVATKQMAYFSRVALFFRTKVLGGLLTKVTKVVMLQGWRKWLLFLALRVKQCSDLLYLSSLVRQLESHHLSRWFQLWRCRSQALEARERYDDVAQLLVETENNLESSQQRWVLEARTVSRQIRLWKLTIASNQLQMKLLSRVMKKWCLYIAAMNHTHSQYAMMDQLADAQERLAEAEADMTLSQDRLLADHERRQQQLVSQRHQHASRATLAVLHRLHFKTMLTRWHAWLQFVRQERDEARLQQCVVSSGRHILHEAGQRMYLWHNLRRVSDRRDLLSVCRLWWRWKTSCNVGQVTTAGHGLVAAMKARAVQVCVMQLQRALDCWKLHVTMWAVAKENNSLAAQTMAFIQRLMDSKMRRMRYRTMARAWHMWTDTAQEMQALEQVRRHAADELVYDAHAKKAKLQALAKERRRNALQGGMKSWKGATLFASEWGKQLSILELLVLRLEKQQLLRGVGQWRTYCVYIKAGMKSE